MAINAAKITSSQTLEEFRLEYNKLQGDVEILKDNPTFTNQLVFEGATADAFETIFTVTDPTADRTVTLPDASGTLLLTGQAAMTLANDGTIGSTGTTDAITIASSGALTFAAGITGTSADFSGVATATTFEPDGDTAAGDNAAIGFTAAEGLILTGQGSTSDITLKNDADGTVFTVPTGTDDILFPDGAMAMWGAASDLQIYHDGSNSIIKDNGAGNLSLRADDFQLTNSTFAENYITAANNGAVTLHFDGATKLATTSGGVTVTGTVTATAGATLLIKNAAGSTLKTIKGMT